MFLDMLETDFVVFF